MKKFFNILFFFAISFCPVGNLFSEQEPWEDQTKYFLENGPGVAQYEDDPSLKYVFWLVEKYKFDGNDKLTNVIASWMANKKIVIDDNDDNKVIVIMVKSLDILEQSSFFNRLGSRFYNISLALPHLFGFFKKYKKVAYFDRFSAFKAFVKKFSSSTNVGISIELDLEEEEHKKLANEHLMRLSSCLDNVSGLGLYGLGLSDFRSLKDILAYVYKVGNDFELDIRGNFKDKNSKFWLKVFTEEIYGKNLEGLKKFKLTIYCDKNIDPTKNNSELSVIANNILFGSSTRGLDL